MRHTCHNQGMVPWVFFPKKLICGKSSHTEWREGWSRQRRMVSAIQSPQQRWHQEEQGALSPAKPCLQWLCYKQTRVSGWGSLVLADAPLSKPLGWGVRQADKLTWPSLVNPVSSWPRQVKPALFPTKCGGCRAAHHLHLLERRGKGCRGSGQQSSLRTAHWDVLCWGGFSFPMRGSD